MPVLTITSRKGGCGKTMLAEALAGVLAERGVDVAILDADPNATAHRWATTVHEGPPFQAYAEADAERLADLLPTLREKHAALIVDTAGLGNQVAAVAIATADVVLVPVTPGEGDLVEAQHTVADANGMSRGTRRIIAVRVVANRIRRGTTLSRHVLAEVDRLELPPLQTTMSEAVAYGEIGFSGIVPKDGTAAEEIAALTAELQAACALP